MRKIINSTYVTLDGVIEDPQLWTFEYRTDEAQQYAHDLLFSCDALITGRRTYESFAEVWPHMEEQTGDFGVRMNTMAKYAVSTTLEKAEWNNTTIIKENVVEEIRRLKEQPGQDIVQYGFGSLTRTMIENGLLDSVRLWIHPVIFGTYPPEGMLAAKDFKASFKLAATTTFSSGLIIADYQPVAAPEK